LQAQGAEFVVRQLAAQVTLQLVAVLRGALMDELAVKVGVVVHGVSQGKTGGELVSQLVFLGALGL
jgi:hypothetical protein